MIKTPNFYSVIIGTELLNGRRTDAHFAFLNQELCKRGWRQKGSFVIEDDTALMENIFNLIKDDENGVMFCFGGIGSTPDDYTRDVAAQVFTHGQMQFHLEAQERILKQFGKESYPHRINMAHLPVGAKLLDNVVNNVPGFYLENRFFFVPGFPSMSQAMVLQALDTYYLKNSEELFQSTLTAQCSENDLISLMQMLPEEIELSSLPKIHNDKRSVVLSLSSINEIVLKNEFKKIISYLEEKHIDFVLKDLNMVSSKNI